MFLNVLESSKSIFFRVLFFGGACQSSRTTGQHGHHRWSVDTQNEHILQNWFRSISPVLDAQIMFPVPPERHGIVWHFSFYGGKAFVRAVLVDIVRRWIEIGREKSIDSKVDFGGVIQKDWNLTERLRHSLQLCISVWPWTLLNSCFLNRINCFVFIRGSETHRKEKVRSIGRRRGNDSTVASVCWLLFSDRSIFEQ